jgi:hypothetical protein
MGPKILLSLHGLRDRPITLASLRQIMVLCQCDHMLSGIIIMGVMDC